MRQIIVGETDQSLKYIYMMVYLLDGVTPALGEAGQSISINVNNTGWTNNFVGPLEDCGFGNYRSLLDNSTFVIGDVILSTYQSANTLQAFGEPIQIVQNLSFIPIFESPTSPISFLSYVSLPEAEQYFYGRLNSSSWTSAEQKDKIAALSMATMDINQLNFIGQKADPSQSLAFPRNIATLNTQSPVYLSQTGVIYYNDPYNNMPNPLSPVTPILINPPEIKIATCEIAYNYLDGVEIESEINRMFVTSQNYTNVSETYTSANEAKRAGINSNKAWIYLKPFVNSGNQLQLVS